MVLASRLANIATQEQLAAQAAWLAANPGSELMNGEKSEADRNSGCDDG